jgi:hypothetical protein
MDHSADIYCAVIASATQQALTVVGNLTLRNWGEHNQGEGQNDNATHYLMLYGVCVTALVETIRC